jgi:hypothetical protein
MRVVQGKCWSAVHWAAGAGHANCIDALSKAGADISALARFALMKWLVNVVTLLMVTIWAETEHLRCTGLPVGDTPRAFKRFWRTVQTWMFLIGAFNAWLLPHANCSPHGSLILIAAIAKLRCTMLLNVMKTAIPIKCIRASSLFRLHISSTVTSAVNHFLIPSEFLLKRVQTSTSAIGCATARFSRPEVFSVYIACRDRNTPIDCVMNFDAYIWFLEKHIQKIYHDIFEYLILHSGADLDIQHPGWVVHVIENHTALLILHWFSLIYISWNLHIFWTSWFAHGCWWWYALGRGNLCWNTVLNQ